MFVLYSLENLAGEVVYVTWDYTTATIFEMRKDNIRGYTYSSIIPDNSMVQVINNNQQQQDYHNYLRSQLVPKGRR